MYTTFGCASCKALGRYLEEHGVPFSAVNLSVHPHLSAPLVSETGMRMVPQVFYQGRYIGGYNDVVSLHRQGMIS